MTIGDIATFKSDEIECSESLWEKRLDILYSKRKLRVGDFSFNFAPRDRFEKVKGYWLNRSENEISRSDTRKNAGMEASLTNVGGVFANQYNTNVDLQIFLQETGNVELPGNN